MKQKRIELVEEEEKNYGEVALGPNLLITIFAFIAFAIALALKYNPLYSPYAILMFGIGSGYLIYSSESMRKGIRNYLIPILITSGGIMAYRAYASQTGLFLDYYVFSCLLTLSAAMLSLAMMRRITFDTAAIMTLLVIGLMVHLSPALNSDILSNVDSYWHYKWMLRIIDEKYIPEYDPLVYPMRGGTQYSGNFTGLVSPNEGVTFGNVEKNSPFLNGLTFASIADILNGNYTSTQIAILLPGVFGAFSVVLMYLLMKEIFFGMEPKNQIAGFAAAFMFMLSPAFGMNSLASNMKDACMGMFLTLAALYLFFASYHRKNYQLSILCGITFLMLRMVWSNGIYAFFTIGVFGTLYSVACFLRNKSSVEHVPYFIAPLVIYQLSGVFQHARGVIPGYLGMSPMEMYPILLTIFLGVLLEMIRLHRHGTLLESNDVGVEILQTNINIIGGLMVLGALAFLGFYKGPVDFWNFIVAGLKYAGSWSVVHQTVAEQNPMATSFSEYLTAGYDKYGIALYFGLMMIPLLIYRTLKDADIRATFMLSWALPIMWGAYGKSSWIFASSAPAAALGASMLLYIAVKKEEFNSLAIIPSILILLIPLTYMPVLNSEGKTPGVVVMHMTGFMDNYLWYPALEWHRDRTPPGAAIVTWWDYGHWITSVAKRPVIADPLQVDMYEIQDLSHFFVNITNEDDAYSLLQTYDKAYHAYNETWGIKYVTYDWTMIGKASAMHYIATGDIKNFTPGSWKSYATCQFLPDYSDKTAHLVALDNGSFTQTENLVFGCNNYLSGIIFTVDQTGIVGITAVDQYGTHIPWDKYNKASDVSVLGVEPLWQPNNQERTPSIMMCAVNWAQAQNSVCSLPQFNTLVLVPQEFNDFMMTKMYLSKYAEEYKQYGLYPKDIVPLKHFREVPDYNGDGVPDGEFSYGYVRSYEVIS